MRLSIKAMVSFWVLLTASTYCNFNLASVSRFLFIRRERNRPPTSAASDVSASASKVVSVGILIQSKVYVNAKFVSLQDPRNLSGVN